MTITGIAGCTALILAGFGIKTVFQKLRLTSMELFLPMILQVNSVKRVTKTPFMMNIKKIRISKTFIL